MKKNFIFLLLSVLILSLFSIISANAQYFNKYNTWASEKHIWPGANNVRLPFTYDKIKFAICGNFYGDTSKNGINIPSIAYFVKQRNFPGLDTIIFIYSIESRGYRVFDPAIDYNDARIVNRQEGLNLDTVGAVINGDTARTHAYTEHPTIERFRDNQGVFENFNNIKFVVSGNFYGNKKHEIMAVYDKADTAQKFICLKNNQFTDTLNYRLTVDWQHSLNFIRNRDSIDINNIKYIVSGNFDNDSLDEIAVLTHYDSDTSHNKFYIFDWDTTNNRWNITRIFDHVNWMWNNNAINFAVSGDFEGDNRDEIACFYSYGYDSSSVQRIILLRSDWPWGWGGDFKFDTIKGNFDWDKISHVVSGNFDGDSLGKKELGIFYDGGLNTDTVGVKSVQKIYFTDHNISNWNMKPEIFEHRKHLNFNKDSLKYVLSGNLDLDSKKRDDIAAVYLGSDHDDQSEFKKLLVWTCLPKFEENPFIMTTNYINEDTHTETTGKFLPLGVYGTRLVSAFIDDSLTGHVADTLIPYFWPVFNLNGVKIDSVAEYSKGRLSNDDIRRYKSVFNTVVPDRGNFTDHTNLWNYKQLVNSNFDFYNGYMNGLRSYLNKAGLEGLKVLPIINIGGVLNYDDIDTVTRPFPVKRYNRFENYNSFPAYFKNIFNSDSGIVNHSAILGWYFCDEPSGFFPRRPQDSIQDPWFFEPQFRLNHQPSMVTNIDTVSNLLRNYYLSIGTVSNRPKFLNFHMTNDFNFYSKSYDVSLFDYYPFSIGWNDKDTAWYENIYCNGITNFSKREYNAMVTNNKSSSMYIGTGWGWGAGWSKFIRPSLKDSLINSFVYTPKYEEMRYSLFSSAIEGLRGYIYFLHDQIWSNDTLSNRVFLTASEFKNYIPIFLQKPINSQVSCSRDKFTAIDYNWSGINQDTYEKYVNYTFIKDSLDNIYYIFISNNHWSTINYPPEQFSAEFTVFVENSTQNSVYELGSDYHKNGLYNIINSNKDNDGNYITFKVNLKQNEIKIVTLGGLPTLRKKTISDSVGLKGSLSYSNQRKMIAYPFRQNSINEYGSLDTIRYHAVYHRLIDGTSRTGIYYRRSKPMTRRYSQELIEWEPKDTLISKYLYEDGRFIDSLCNCIYPSIVSRFDTSANINKPRIYIVYTCKKSLATTHYIGDNYVIESRFFPNDSLQSITQIGNIIAAYDGYDMNKWGTPVVNASRNGNYYAWSDSTRGIVAGWKLPSQVAFDTLPASMKEIHWNFLPQFDRRIEITHPSINSYSRIKLGEDDCALVWQEMDSSLFAYPPQLACNHIYYTRLRMKNGSLENYLPKRFSNPVYNVSVNADTSIAWLTDSPLFIDRTSTFPVVYRGVEDYSDRFNPLDSSDILRNHHDRVYWQNQLKFGNGNQISSIYLRGIDIKDSLFNNNPDSWFIYYPYRFRSLENSLSQPNVSQGYLRPYFDQNFNNIRFTNENDSILVLNFKYQRYGATDDYSSKIWQVNQSYWNIYYQAGSLSKMIDTIETTQVSYAKPLTGFGRYSQLSAMPVVKGRGEWLANRRIFETGNNYPPNIASSLQFFYKKNSNDEGAIPFLGFIKDSIPGLISSIQIFDNEYNKIEPKILTRIKVGDYYEPLDTLESSWFNLEDFSKIAFFSFGKAEYLISIKLERKSDGNTFFLPLKYFSDTTYTLNQYTFIGSNNENYRLKIIKKSNDLNYFEELYFGSLPDVGDAIELIRDSLNIIGNYKIINNFYDLISKHGDNVIDFSNDFEFTVFPNPACSEIVIKPLLPKELLNSQDKLRNLQIEYTIYSIIGKPILSFTGNPTENIYLNNINVESGIYYISGILMNSANPINDVRWIKTKSLIIVK
jgi:hypothetical protein